MVRLGGAFVLITWALLEATAALGADFYVSPSGTTSTGSGTGTVKNPWSLQTALAQPPGVRPGDTIWLRGGSYVGRFNSYLAGTESQPIVVRQYPGETARIDGGPGPLAATLMIWGQYTWYWGFEVFSSSTRRRSAQDGSVPTDLNRGTPVFVSQDAPHPGLKFINMLVHDGTDGISAFVTGPDMEIYGNLVYNNGWDGATDRGHGHGLYLQNQTGTKKVSDNIVFNNFGNGINIYGSSSAFLDNFELTGNTLFNAGAPSKYGSALNLLFGGGRVARDGSLRANYLAGGGGVNIGYSAGTGNFVIQDNWFGQIFGCDFIGPMKNLLMTGNRFRDDIWGMSPAGFPLNTYFHGVRPTGTFVYVRRNVYEEGRANITIYNWDRSPTVSVDLGSVLAVGAPFEVRNAQDFQAPPVVSGVYAGGALSLPMTGLSVAPPIGGDVAPPVTGPEFNVFVLLTPSTGANIRRRAPDVPPGPAPVRRDGLPK